MHKNNSITIYVKKDSECNNVSIMSLIIFGIEITNLNNYKTLLKLQLIVQRYHPTASSSNALGYCPISRPSFVRHFDLTLYASDTLNYIIN